MPLRRNPGCVRVYKAARKSPLSLYGIPDRLLTFGSLPRRKFSAVRKRPPAQVLSNARSPPSTRWRPELQALSDRAAPRPYRRCSRPQLAAGKTLDDILVPAFATVREAAKRDARPAAFRRAADRRHGPARGPHRRDEAPAKARPWSRRCRSTSTRSPARACMSSRSTTTWPSATPSGWARSTASSA